jgi:ribosomal protein L11 methyltransferase
MNWIQIRAQVAPAAIEALEEGLLAAGAVAITMEDGADQPLLEPDLGTTPVWDNTVITGLFESDTDTKEATLITKNVFTTLCSNEFPLLNIDFLENEDWTRKWIENFKAISFGDRLWICPSWCAPPEPDAVNLMLDPGLAFGTGTHATTALCLRWLDQADLIGKTVIDYGCGSGILGIAAILLGAERVIAVDNDPQALQATLLNAKRNKVATKKIEVFFPENCPDVNADIVLANILAKPLYALAETLVNFLPVSGQLVLSGILEAQAYDLNAHYAKLCDMSEPVFEGDWSRLSGKKK